MSTPEQFCTVVAVAVETSGAKWIVGSCSGLKVRRKSLCEETATARADALFTEVATALARFGGDERTRVVVAYEAGQEGFWLVRRLRALGIEAEVIDPVSLKVDRRAKRAKTDRIDVEMWARALYSWMAGDTGALRMVRVPSEQDEDNREWQRERDRLKAERRSCLDRIGKKMRTHGIWHWDPVALRAVRLRRADGEPLGAMLQQVKELDTLFFERPASRRALRFRPSIYRAISISSRSLRSRSLTRVESSTPLALASSARRACSGSSR